MAPFVEPRVAASSKVTSPRFKHRLNNELGEYPLSTCHAPPLVHLQGAGPTADRGDPTTPTIITPQTQPTTIDPDQAPPEASVPGRDQPPNNESATRPHHGDKQYNPSLDQTLNRRPATATTTSDTTDAEQRDEQAVTSHSVERRDGPQGGLSASAAPWQPKTGPPDELDMMVQKASKRFMDSST